MVASRSADVLSSVDIARMPPPRRVLRSSTVRLSSGRRNHTIENMGLPRSSRAMVGVYGMTYHVSGSTSSRNTRQSAMSRNPFSVIIANLQWRATRCPDDLAIPGAEKCRGGVRIIRGEPRQGACWPSDSYGGDSHGGTNVDPGGRADVRAVPGLSRCCVRAAAGVQLAVLRA